MPIATVTVAGKAEPEIGKKRGRIKSQDGMVFQADPNFLRQVNVGSTYDIEYQDREFQGAKFRVVESAVPSMAGLANQYQAPTAPPARQAQPQYRVPMAEDRRGEDIATLAIVKCWLDRVPVGDTGAVVHALKSARAAWLQFKAGGDAKIESGPSLKDELNDEIPEL